MIKSRNEAGLQEKNGKQRKESHQGQCRAPSVDCFPVYLCSELTLYITQRNRPPQGSHVSVLKFHALVGDCLVGRTGNLRGEKLNSLNQDPPLTQTAVDRVRDLRVMQ